jgi:hypothetical protein
MDIGSDCYCFRKCEKELPVVSHFCEISLRRKSPTGIFAGFRRERMDTIYTSQLQDERLERV